MDTSEYMPMFLAEAQEHLQELNLAVVRLEEDPRDRETVDEIFRAAHSLKGMSATMGFAQIAKLTHEMEDVFELAAPARRGPHPRGHRHRPGLPRCPHRRRSSRSRPTARRPLTPPRWSSGCTAWFAPAPPSRSSSASPTSPGPQRRAGHGRPPARAPHRRRPGRSGPDAGRPRAHGVRRDGRARRADRQRTARGRHRAVLRSAPRGVGRLRAGRGGRDQDDRQRLGRGRGRDRRGRRPCPGCPAPAVAVAVAEPEVEADTAAEPARAAEPAKAAAPKASSAARTVRVDAERLDALMHSMGELVIHRTAVEALTGSLDVPGLQQAMQELTRSSQALQSMVMQVRMIPVDVVFLRFPRLVRDLSGKLGKEVKLNLVGSETELDRTVVDALGDPLVHLVRNSLDHGLEPVEERVAAGKPEVGTLEISARHSGGSVVIEVRDDGRGINPEAVARNGRQARADRRRGRGRDQHEDRRRAAVRSGLLHRGDHERHLRARRGHGRGPYQDPRAGRRGPPRLRRGRGHDRPDPPAADPGDRLRAARRRG